MKIIEKVILIALEKASREFVDYEKNGSMRCPSVFFQPVRPMEIKKEKWS